MFKLKDRVQQRLDEINAGRRRVILYEKLERVDKETTKLGIAFPALSIASVLNAPYTHVTIRARRQFLAPIESMAVLQDDNLATYNEVTLTDPIDGFPSDHLVTQLALIS